VLCACSMCVCVRAGSPLQDSQEFLRCLMDQLHEELKESIPEPDDHSGSMMTMDEGLAEDSSDSRSQSDNDFQSCESCGSSERADRDAAGDRGRGSGTGTNWLYT